MDIIELLGILSIIQLIIYVALYFGWLRKKGKQSGGLYLAVALFRYVFYQNTTQPCFAHYTSQVIDGQLIRIPEKKGYLDSVRKSFLQSGNCYYQAKNGIWIEAGARWAPGVKFISANRAIGGYKSDDPIRLMPNCLIGANAVILPGVTIGRNAVIGAGAVVTRDVPDNEVWAENPARCIDFVGDTPTPSFPLETCEHCGGDMIALFGHRSAVAKCSICKKWAIPEIEKGGD